MKCWEATDSQLGKRSVNMLERRWTAVVDRENVCIVIWSNGKKKEMGEVQGNWCLCQWKAPGAWTVSREQLVPFFCQSEGVVSRDTVSLFAVWQEGMETEFRKQNIAPRCYFVKSMLDLPRVKVVSSHFDIKRNMNIEVETVGILTKIVLVWIIINSNSKSSLYKVTCL